MYKLKIMKKAWLGKTIANSVEVIIHTPALWMNLNATLPSFPFKRSNFLRGDPSTTQPTAFHSLLLPSRHPSHHPLNIDI